jgi:hypothetical protein
MTTPSDIKERIKTALDDAFRTPEKLKEMLQYKLGENFYKYGVNIGLSDIISELINTFDSQNRLDELVIAAIRANPTNLMLHNLADIIDIQSSVNNKLSEDFSDLLKTILNKIDFNIIKTVLFGTLLEKIKDTNKLDSIKSKFKDVEEIPNEQFKNGIECFLIKKLLLEEYETLIDRNNKKVLTVLRFVENLANNTELKRAKNSQILEDWVAKMVTRHGLDHSSSPESESDGSIRSYLLIIIKREENNQYRINAYLIPNEEDKDNIEPLDIELAEKGILCTFDQIKKNIPNFIDQSAEALSSKTTRPWELTIEFFLPTEHLNEQVEHWDFSSQGSLERYIGDEYSVVVRSYERLKKYNYINSLRQGRLKLTNVRQKLEMQSIQDVKCVFEHLESLDTFNWRELRNKLLEKEKIGLKISSPLPSTSETKYKELFQAIFDSGTPIVIWKRSSSIPHNLNVDCQVLVNSSNLFSLVLSERRAAYGRSIQERERHLGYHVGILCEEPNLEEYSDLNAALKNL